MNCSNNEKKSINDRSKRRNKKKIRRRLDKNCGTNNGRFCFPFSIVHTYYIHWLPVTVDCVQRYRDQSIGLVITEHNSGFPTCVIDPPLWFAHKLQDGRKLQRNKRDIRGEEEMKKFQCDSTTVVVGCDKTYSFPFIIIIVSVRVSENRSRRCSFTGRKTHTPDQQLMRMYFRFLFVINRRRIHDFYNF